MTGFPFMQGLSIITRELVDSTFPDTSPVFWATLRCADGCRARPAACEEGLQQGRDRAGESGSSVHGNPNRGQVSALQR